MNVVRTCGYLLSIHPSLLALCSLLFLDFFKYFFVHLKVLFYHLQLKLKTASTEIYINRNGFDLGSGRKCFSVFRIEKWSFNMNLSFQVKTGKHWGFGSVTEIQDCSYNSVWSEFASASNYKTIFLARLVACEYTRRGARRIRDQSPRRFFKYSV